MATPFDPRKVLKQIANPMLREFFSRRDELTDIPWGTLTEHKIEPVFKGWQALPERQRVEVQMILRDISSLADHRGMAVLAEEIPWRCPERTEDFMAQTSKADKAMWVYLNVREMFDDAALFARADALASGRYWIKRNGLPKRTLAIDDALQNRLSEALTSFYDPAQMRGRFCEIAHYRRSVGADYFFAYLDDYPDKHVVFDDGGESVVRADRYAFENLFVYNDDEGSMEVYAPGGKKVWAPLQVAFCKAVLGIDVPPADPLRPSFHLDHLMTPNFPLPTDPNDMVDEARIMRLRLAPRGAGGYVEVKADPKAGPDDIHRKINRWLKMENIPAERTRVAQATFSLKFVHDGPGRQPTLTFDVSAPHSSNLKSKPDEQRAVGERCLKLWGVVHDEG